MSDIIFLHKGYLFLLLLLVPLIAWYIWKESKISATLQMSSLRGFEGMPTSKKVYLRHLPFIFRVLALALIVVVIARPQSTNNHKEVTTEGIDIVVALDVSTSMLAQDFKPNRLEAAKDVAMDFVSGRTDDNIGLVIFAAESFTQCPMTTDHEVLINLFQDIQTGVLEDGTAIGMGLATSVTRIKDSKAKSKVIILLTDGVNNKGEVAPLKAAEFAKKFGVRVYTIGVGTIGMAPYPMETNFGVQLQNMEVKIDEPMLKEIAKITDGKYFRATNKSKLAEIYREIDSMEKTRIEEREFSKRAEEYHIFAIFATLFLLLELALRNTILRHLP